MSITGKYYTWEEYAPNRFRRWDCEAAVWVVMEIHTCCIHYSKERYISQGRNFKEAKLALKSAKDLINGLTP